MDQDFTCLRLQLELSKTVYPILGLAGVAVEAGVRSALASLWFIQAPTVTLVTEFYKHWYKLGKSKAQVQADQQALIEACRQYTHLCLLGIHYSNW